MTLFFILNNMGKLHEISALCTCAHSQTREPREWRWLHPSFPMKEWLSRFWECSHWSALRCHPFPGWSACVHLLMGVQLSRANYFGPTQDNCDEPFYFCGTLVVVQLLSGVWPLATPWTAARQASLSFTISWSLCKLMSIEPLMLFNHLILCCSILLLPSIFPSIWIFSSESVLCIRWPKYWSLSLSFSINPSNEYSGLISFRMDWFDVLAVQVTLKSLLQHNSLKASIRLKPRLLRFGTTDVSRWIILVKGLSYALQNVQRCSCPLFTTWQYRSLTPSTLYTKSVSNIIKYFLGGKIVLSWESLDESCQVYNFL